MAIQPSTYGFPGGSIDAAALPEWVKTARARFSVSGANDWKVTALGSLDRGIRVEVGTGHGDGVTVTTHEYETMSLPYPDIATRWYLIARRRNWSGTGTATLVALPGDATASLPAVGNAATQMKNKPGVESDQPLALVRVTQKDRTVQEIIDLRAWAGPGGVEAAHTLALSYLAEPGAAVKIGRAVYRYELQANNVWDWARYAQTTSVGLTGSAGWGVVGEIERAGSDRLRAAIRLVKFGGTMSVSSSNGFTSLTGDVLPVGSRPVTRHVDVPVALTSSANTWGGIGVMRLGTNGVMSYMPVQPAQQSIGSGAHFHVSAEWFAV